MNFPKNTPGNCQGFALVIALSLMAFVLLLLLSITTLVQVETQSAQIRVTQTEAKQNALLGLQQALGALQVSMGPDQRISATADVLAASPSSGTEYFVGVWSSEDADGDGRADGSFNGWLVSNDDENAAGADRKSDSINFVNQAAPIQVDGAGVYRATQSNYEVLLGGGSVAQDPDTPQIMKGVVAQKILIQSDSDSASGSYAWWIGDEGVKARVNLSRAEAPDATTRQRAVLEAGSSSIANAAVLDDLASVDFEGDGKRILSLSELDILDGSSEDAANQYFHDLTAHSVGVLADVKEGGLKQDLSLAFEMSDTGFNASALAAGGAQTVNAPGFGDVQPVFWEPVSGVDTPAHGPVWHLLRDYYRLYHAMETPMTNPTIDARVFGPNLNHGDSSLQSPSSLSASTWSFDQQPAALFAGGKAKFYNQAKRTLSPFHESGVQTEQDAGAAAGIPPDSVALDMAMVDSDPIRLDSVGDPLRGGGQRFGDTTMPVMVTGNYLPYMQRYVMEIGFWFKRWKDANGDYIPVQTSKYPGKRQDRYENPVAIHQVNRQRFVLHNPYNVTLRHDEIGLDSAGCETSIEIVKKGQTDGMNMILNDGGNSTYKTPKQRFSYRQVRIPSGVFAPGELKTFNGALHSNTASSPVSYATEGIDPTWSTTYATTGDVITTFIKAPDGAGVDPASVPYTLYLSGDNIGSPEQIQSVWQNRTNSYSMAQFAFLTHLKQPGNAAFEGHAIAGRWPMASIIDTGLLFPGPGYSTEGRENFVFGAGRPNMTSNFFPDGGENSVQLTAELIDTHFEQQSPYTLATIDLQLKSTQFERTETRYPAFSRTNPLAPVRDNKNLLPADDLIENSVGYPALSPDLNITFSDDGTGGFTGSLDYWGPTDGSINDTAAGVANPVLLELPTAPVLSMGKLQHANISVHAHMPALAIGNSLASPYIDPESTATVLTNRYSKPRVFYDLSYLMNEALWDRYFFSSYSRPYDATKDAYGTNVAETFDDLLGNDRPLPNTRMRWHTASAEGATQVRAKLFDVSGGEVLGDAYERAAENLMVAGSFNVNSTSVEAWRAVLSGARDFAIYQSGEAAPTQPSIGTTPFSRLSQPVSGESDGTDSSAPTTWSGFRALKETEIDALAAAIVSELKARIAVNGQPYLSLGDFVNRELSAGASGRAGLLQAAIDQSGINDGLKSAFDAVATLGLSDADNGIFPHAANISDANGEASSANQAAPGYLMQADILQAIGSFITVRSDTFRIRSYGASHDPISGKVRSEVWLEAIVQRLPEPVNPPAGTSPDAQSYWQPLDANGQQSPFGRQFKIVSLRQLSSDEV